MGAKSLAGANQHSSFYTQFLHFGFSYYHFIALKLYLPIWFALNLMSTHSFVPIRKIVQREAKEKGVFLFFLFPERVVRKIRLSKKRQKYIYMRRKADKKTTSDCPRASHYLAPSACSHNPGVWCIAKVQNHRMFRVGRDLKAYWPQIHSSVLNHKQQYPWACALTAMPGVMTASLPQAEWLLHPTQTQLGAPLTQGGTF